MLSCCSEGLLRVIIFQFWVSWVERTGSKSYILNEGCGYVIYYFQGLDKTRKITLRNILLKP